MRQYFLVRGCNSQSGARGPLKSPRQGPVIAVSSSQIDLCFSQCLLSDANKNVLRKWKRLQAIQGSWPIFMMSACISSCIIFTACCAGMLLASNLMRSLAFTIAYGSFVFLVVFTVIEPSTRFSSQETPFFFWGIIGKWPFSTGQMTIVKIPLRFKGRWCTPQDISWRRARRLGDISLYTWGRELQMKILPINFPSSDLGSIHRASNGRCPRCPMVYLSCTCCDFSTWLQFKYFELQH